VSRYSILETAAVPARIIPKSLVIDRLINDTIVKKYCDHLPFSGVMGSGQEYPSRIYAFLLRRPQESKQHNVLHRSHSQIKLRPFLQL
jgi:hypothetical protein